MDGWMVGFYRPCASAMLPSFARVDGPGGVIKSTRTAKFNQTLASRITTSVQSPWSCSVLLVIYIIHPLIRVNGAEQDNDDKDEECCMFSLAMCKLKIYLEQEAHTLHCSYNARGVWVYEMGLRHKRSKWKN